MPAYPAKSSKVGWTLSQLYGGLHLNEARRLRQLEDENRPLKKLVTAAAERRFEPGGEPPAGGAALESAAVPCPFPERVIADHGAASLVRAAPSGDVPGVTELPALNGPTRIRVLVADDHPVVRLGLSALLATEPDLELVAEAEQGEEAVARFRERRVTVALARGLIDLPQRHSPSG
jgi:hypothetical protein